MAFNRAFKQAGRIVLGMGLAWSSLSATIKTGRDYCKEMRGFFADCCDATGTIQNKVAEIADQFQQDLRDVHEDFWAAVYEMKKSMIPAEMKPCLRTSMRQLQEAIIKDEVPAVLLALEHWREIYERDTQQGFINEQRILQLEEESRNLQERNAQLREYINTFSDIKK